MTVPFLCQKGADTRISVFLQPGASADGISGEHNGMLKVRVTAPPEKGRTNKALCRILTRRLGLPGAACTLIKGKTSREKTVIVRKTSPQDILNRLYPDENH